jgi:hypothetical protein
MSLLDMLKPETEDAPEAVVESPKEELTLDGFIQLQIILRDREKADSQPIHDEIAKIEAKMAAESAIVDAYQSFDVAEAAKQPDWDRASAAQMAANAEISAQIIAGLETDLYTARHKLGEIHKEYGRLNSMLNTHADQMNVTRKAVLIEYLQGNGKLQIDRDHARRWLNVFVAAKSWMETNFDDEHQDAIDYCIEQLSDYQVPPPTVALFNHLTDRDKEAYKQFKPQQGAQ